MVEWFLNQGCGIHGKLLKKTHKYMRKERREVENKRNPNRSWKNLISLETFSVKSTRNSSGIPGNCHARLRSWALDFLRNSSKNPARMTSEIPSTNSWENLPGIFFFNLTRNAFGDFFENYLSSSSICFFRKFLVTLKFVLEVSQKINQKSI